LLHGEKIWNEDASFAWCYTVSSNGIYLTDVSKEGSASDFWVKQSKKSELLDPEDGSSAFLDMALCAKRLKFLLKLL